MEDIQKAIFYKKYLDNKKARHNFLTVMNDIKVKKKPLKFKGQSIDKIYFEESITEDFISNQVKAIKAIIENENKIAYGIISLIMKKCNCKQLIIEQCELENITKNELISIIEPISKNIILKVGDKNV